MLYWDLAVPRLTVKVEVENRWVTISGMVDRPYERECAESDARGVPGVVGVTNEIRLAPAQADWPQSNPHYATPDLAALPTQSELSPERAVQEEKDHGRH